MRVMLLDGLLYMAARNAMAEGKRKQREIPAFPDSPKPGKPQPEIGEQSRGTCAAERKGKNSNVA
ncbi:MAG: hypothetical protein UCJ19_12775 [Oscillospiraceae bacterium]|uniref:hypothetical protein n=1 Tax=Neglectibacter timonensis TaxID=1776382 RepID=UPI00266D2436|nr:hypothetical protein [Neglectibacter timonensis]MEE0731416.1 hypothetical protein [Oscillospiraceae bacterium]